MRDKKWREMFHLYEMAKILHVVIFYIIEEALNVLSDVNDISEKCQECLKILQGCVSLLVQAKMNGSEVFPKSSKEIDKE